MSEEVNLLLSEIKKSKRIIFFTGAGISTESGIPDFRGAEGIWKKYSPQVVEYSRFLASHQNRKEYWEFSNSLYRKFKSAKPNAAHYAIAKMERLGYLDCIITQNIDNLHQKAGNSEEKILELHGNAFKVRCLNCNKYYSREEIEKNFPRDGVPSCVRCDGILKPTTILFGEPLPEKVLEEAFRRARKADLLIVLGSSLVVYPAALIPLEVIQQEGKLVIVNLTPTQYDKYADIVIYEKCGKVMKEVMERLN